MCDFANESYGAEIQCSGACSRYFSKLGFVSLEILSTAPDVAQVLKEVLLC